MMPVSVLADLREGIESTLNLLAKQYQDRITVHRDYDYLPLVECYPGQINQVFMNLLQNAAQAIQQRGEVGLKPNRIAVGLRSSSRIMASVFRRRI